MIVSAPDTPHHVRAVLSMAEAMERFPGFSADKSLTVYVYVDGGTWAYVGVKPEIDGDAVSIDTKTATMMVLKDHAGDFHVPPLPEQQP